MPGSDRARSSIRLPPCHSRTSRPQTGENGRAGPGSTRKETEWAHVGRPQRGENGRAGLGFPEKATDRDPHRAARFRRRKPGIRSPECLQTKNDLQYCKSFSLVGTCGFEPQTSCLSSRRSKPTELCSLYKKTTCIAVSGRSLILWELRDSNPRPSACKADALNQLS